VIHYLIQDPAKSGQVPQWVEDPAPPWTIDDYGQLEKLASTFSHVDNLFYFTYVVCIVSFVLITGVLGYSVVKWRRRSFDQPAASNVTHNTVLEVTWTVIPLIIVMIMFAWGWKGSLDMQVVPADARQYKAVAKQWSWTFLYPHSAVSSMNELWLEIDKPAAFTLESTDVLHAFFIPAMRVKRDVVPGRLQTLWFQPTEIGEFHLFCAEYCGKDHSKMYAKVHVVSAEDYQKEPWNVWDDSDPAAGGQRLWGKLCASCHTVNGTPNTGPTWAGLFAKNADGEIVGTQRDVIENGETKTVTVDNAYLIESVRFPNAKKVVGFENQTMSAFPNLDDKRLNGIIEYMKTLPDQQ